MDNMYFKNAFLTLGHLNEEKFNVADQESVNSLKDFLDAEDIEEPTQEVIDMDAETEEDLEDSYIGKLILKCDVCNALIYKDPHDLVINEEEQIAEIGEECPECQGETEYKIVGKVCPYEPEPEVDIEVEDKYDLDAAIDVDDEEDDSDDEEKEESVKVKAINDKKVTESIDYAARRRMHEGKHFCKECGEFVEEPCEDCKKEEDEVEEGLAGAVAGGALGAAVGHPIAGAAVGSMAQDTLNNITSNEELEEGLEKVDLETEDKIIHISEEEKPEVADAEMIEPLSSEEEAQFETPEDFGDEFADLEAEEEVPAEDEFAEEEVGAEEAEEEAPLTESVEEAPKAASTIQDKIDKEALKQMKIQTKMMELDLEAKRDEICPECEDKEEVEAPVEDEEEVSIEDFDEDQFNELSENYLKNIYQNIESFNTTDVSIKGDDLMIEGYITFNSGKTKTTNFNFTADTKCGNQLKFFGENLQISSGKKSFTLRGQLDGSKFIAESLTYNYRAKNSKGLSERVYGTARTKLCEANQKPNEVNLNPKKVEEPKQTTNSAVKGDKYEAKPWAPVEEKIASGVYDDATKTFKDVDGKTITVGMGGVIYNPVEDKYYQFDGKTYKLLKK